MQPSLSDLISSQWFLRIASSPSISGEFPLWTGLQAAFPCAVRVQLCQKPSQTVDIMDKIPPGKYARDALPPYIRYGHPQPQLWIKWLWVRPPSGTHQIWEIPCGFSLFVYLWGVYFGQLDLVQVSCCSLVYSAPSRASRTNIKSGTKIWGRSNKACQSNHIDWQAFDGLAVETEFMFGMLVQDYR